jgi:capsular exopolysaccharide synthesis family protein
MELPEVWAAFRAGWWLLVISLLLGAGVAFGVSHVQTPLYQSSTQMFVSATSSRTASDALDGSQLAQQRVSSYAALLTGPDLAARVIDRLGLSMTPHELSQEITATVASGTVLIDIVVTDPSAQRAQQIADAVGKDFPAIIARLETSPGGGTSPVKATVTYPPTLPDAPSSPKILRNLAIGGALGLLLGVGVAFVRSVLDRTIKSSRDVGEVVKAPVVGLLMRDKQLAGQHLAGVGSRAEDFRRLRINLKHLGGGQTPSVLMITSAGRAEGKTTVAINLGIALAEAGRRVTIVEADLRWPAIAARLGMDDKVGLAQVLADRVTVDDAVQRYGADDLSIIPAGPIPPNPGELVASGSMPALLEKLRERNDVVIVDAPALLPVADSSELAAHVDGVLLSVRYGVTRTELLGRAVAALERVGVTPLGVVLNVVPPGAESAAALGLGRVTGLRGQRERLAGLGSLLGRAFSRAPEPSARSGAAWSSAEKRSSDSLP